MDLRNTTSVLSYFTQSTERNSATILKEENQVRNINDEEFEKVYLPTFIFSIMMLILGSLGNTIVLYVYFSKWKKTTYRVFILALAVLDLINGLITIPSELYFMQNWFQTTNGFLCKVSRFCTYTLNFSSAFTLISIAGDRYFRVCWPLRKQLSIKKARIIVLVGISMAVVFALPILFIYRIQSTVVPIAPQRSVLGHTCKMDEFKDAVINKIFFIIVFIGNLLTISTLFIIYGLIAVNVRKRFIFVSKASRKNQTDKDQGEPSFESKVENESIKSVRRLSVLELTEYSQEEMNTPNKVTSKIAHVNSDTSKNCTTSRSRSVFSLQNEKNQVARSQKVTLMLFLVTMIFILTFSPFIAIVIIHTVQPNYYTNLSYEGKAIYHFFMRFYFLSMSANPVLYSFLSEKFKMECRNVVRRSLEFLHEILT